MESGPKLPTTHLLKIHLRRTLSQTPRSNAYSTKYLPRSTKLTLASSPIVLPTPKPNPIEPTAEPLNQTPFDPLSAPIPNMGMFPASQPAPGTEWGVQDLVWSNLPWDWNLMDDIAVDGITADNDGNWNWGPLSGTETQINGNNLNEVQ